MPCSCAASAFPDFIGLPYQVLNGSLWTILIEFRCYLFVVLFGAMGLYRRQWRFVLVTLGLLVAMEAKLHPRNFRNRSIGWPEETYTT